MENAGYLLAAFIIAWAFVFGYILLLYNKQRRLQQEIDSLKEALKEKGTEQ
jgi:CcmD family protein